MSTTNNAYNDRYPNINSKETHYHADDDMFFSA